MIGVISESAYFRLGSPACIDLVDKDLPPRVVFFCLEDLGIILSFHSETLYPLTARSRDAVRPDRKPVFSNGAKRLPDLGCL